MAKSTMNPGPVTLDVIGLELNAEDRRRILHPLTGGVILFGRNFTNRKQLTKLTSEIKKLRSDGTLEQLQVKWFGFKMTLSDSIPSFN